MKFIDAEQLKAELDKRYAEYRTKMKTDDFTYYEGMADALDHFEQYIDSLPEQLVDITSAGSGAMGTVPPKFKLDVKPAEVDLEKFTEKIKTFQGRYKHPEIISIKGAMAFMARMFYQYPNVARQWYEKLRKVTMD